jgi:RES domain-containing protein
LKEAWRLCRRPHADLLGEGARLWGGRWNSAGRPVVYLSDHPALAVLEVRVHLDLPLELLPDDYVLVRVRLPGETPSVISEPQPDPKATGDAWLLGADSAILSVPSVLVPCARNLLLNPLHPRAADAAIAATTEFRFDPRLWAGHTSADHTSGTNA